MKRLKLEIDLENAAFNDGANGYEIARILRKLAAGLVDENVAPGAGGRLTDCNGNCVGGWDVKNRRVR